MVLRWRYLLLKVAMVEAVYCERHTGYKALIAVPVRNPIL